MTFLVLPKKGWKNMISLRKSSTAERGNPFPVKNHLFFFFFHSFLCDPFAFSSYLLRRASTAAGVKILVSNHRHI